MESLTLILSLDRRVPTNSYVEVECKSFRQESTVMLLYCSENGWDLAKSVNVCETQQKYEFELSLEEGRIECAHVKNIINEIMEYNIIMTCEMEPMDLPTRRSLQTTQQFCTIFQKYK